MTFFTSTGSSSVSDWFWDDRRLSGFFGVNADTDICPFGWFSNVSGTLADFQKFSVPIEIMTFLLQKDPPESFSLVCDLFWVTLRLSGILVVNAENDISYLLGPSWSHFLVCDWFWGTHRLSGIFDAKADIEIVYFKGLSWVHFFGLRLILGQSQTFRNFWCQQR
jgi:hypothetical protein